MLQIRLTKWIWSVYKTLKEKQLVIEIEKKQKQVTDTQTKMGYKYSETLYSKDSLLNIS